MLLLLPLLLSGTLLGEDSLLVVKDPQRHAYLRALLQPAFGPDAIASYLPDIEVSLQAQQPNVQAVDRFGTCSWCAAVWPRTRLTILPPCKAMTTSAAGV
jgi:hypothetical protein